MKKKSYSAEKILNDHARSKVAVRILGALLIFLFVVASTTYIIVLVVNQESNSIVIGANNSDLTYKSISLYDNSEFENPTTHLDIKSESEMNNITYSMINSNVYDSDGDVSFQNCLGYTFYLRNEGSETLDFNMQIQLIDPTKNIETALRVLVLEDSLQKVYGLANQETGESEMISNDELLMCQDFTSNTMVCDYDFLQLESQDYVRYTILVWLEGEDPDCIDDILGGTFKLQVDFEVLDD